MVGREELRPEGWMGCVLPQRGGLGLGRKVGWVSAERSGGKGLGRKVGLAGEWVLGRKVGWGLCIGTFASSFFGFLCRALRLCGPYVHVITIAVASHGFLEGVSLCLSCSWVRCVPHVHGRASVVVAQGLTKKW